MGAIRGCAHQHGSRSDSGWTAATISTTI
jgi:hypothetical protein